MHTLCQIPDTFVYNAGAACGKNAAVGGWYNTFPIPFNSTALVTVRNNAAGCTNGYINIRGTENLPIVCDAPLRVSKSSTQQHHHAK